MAERTSYTTELVAKKILSNRGLCLLGLHNLRKNLVVTRVCGIANGVQQEIRERS